MSISVIPAPSTAAGPDAKVFQIDAAYTATVSSVDDLRIMTLMGAY